MKKFVLLCGMAIGLMACQPQVSDPATNSNVTVGTNQTIETTPSNCGISSGTNDDEKALLTAETAYNVPAQAYVKLGGNLPATTRAQVRAYLIQAYDYLKLARTAYNAADNCSLARYRDLTEAVGGKAKALLPK